MVKETVRSFYKIYVYKSMKSIKFSVQGSCVHEKPL